MRPDSSMVHSVIFCNIFIRGFSEMLILFSKDPNIPRYDQ